MSDDLTLNEFLQMYVDPQDNVSVVKYTHCERKGKAEVLWEGHYDKHKFREGSLPNFNGLIEYTPMVVRGVTACFDDKLTIYVE